MTNYKLQYIIIAYYTEENNTSINEKSFNNNQSLLENQQNRMENIKPKINIWGILAIGVVTIIVAIIISTKLLSNKKNETLNNNITENNQVSYYDKSRSINSTYTFDEATSKFAFKATMQEYNKQSTFDTLIFEEKDNLKLSRASRTISNNDDFNIEFYYKYNQTISFNYDFYQSDSNELNDFVEDFKKLRDVNRIIELNNDYVYIEYKLMNFETDYCFAKKIGNRVFYATTTINNDDKENEYKLALIGFQELFNSLKNDNGKEPYLQDKILNVPMVLNKKIKNHNLIDAIITLIKQRNSFDLYSQYKNGEVHLNDGKVKTSFYIYYDAEKYYKVIKWDKDITSNIKNKDFYYGITDGKLTQVFFIYPDIEKTKKSIDEYLSVFLD